MISARHRSYLFVPGNRPDRFDKALASGADQVIVDLEDSVPPDQKNEARRQVAAWLSASKPVILRINSVETPWFRDDIEMCRLPGVAAVMLAKSERTEDIARLGNSLPCIPLIESAVGFANIRSIAAAVGVHRLAFGAIDFQLDMNMAALPAELMFFRSEFVLASRLASIGAPIDSPSITIDEAQIVEAEASHALRLGFAGKLCIHPRQVEAVNLAFTPRDEEIVWARRVIAAAAASGHAAVALDGKMIDGPVVKAAEALLRVLSQ